jgi:F0F1-type ATP synthase delta subunit
MKYPVKIYAEALAQSTAAVAPADEAAIAKNFLELVNRNGDGPHLGKIIEEAARILRGKLGIRKVSFESARPMSPAQKKEMHAFAGPCDIVEERIDPSLVAGVRIIVDDERQFDGSLKGKLDKLFGNT